MITHLVAYFGVGLILWLFEQNRYQPSRTLGTLIAMSLLWPLGVLTRAYKLIFQSRAYTRI